MLKILAKYRKIYNNSRECIAFLFKCTSLPITIIHWAVSTDSYKQAHIAIKFETKLSLSLGDILSVSFQIPDFTEKFYQTLGIKIYSMTMLYYYISMILVWSRCDASCAFFVLA